MKFTYDEVINGIIHGGDGHLDLEPEEAFTVAKILLNKGYAVLFTGGDIGNEIRVEWRYAGDIGNLKYADRSNVAFGSPEFVDMLATGDYISEDDEEKE